MKYTVQSGKYVAKNFIFLFPFAILPAILLSFSTDEKAIIQVFEAIFQGNISDWTFFMLFQAISALNFGSWQSLVFGILGVVLIVPCVAMMMALVEKHFRIGKRTFNGIWSKLNDNLLPTCVYALFLLVFYEVWALLLAALLFFMSRISMHVLAFSLCGGVFFVMHMFLLYVIGSFYLWLPCMQITGFRALEALQYSNQLMSNVKWQILFAQILVLLVSESLICLCAVFVQNAVVFTALTMLLYLFMIMLYCVRMQIAYFELDHIQRADLAQYYQR